MTTVALEPKMKKCIEMAMIEDKWKQFEELVF